jgi:hypothetical protein
MVVVIRKKDGKKKVAAALKALENKATKTSLADFYGKMKGKYGDGLEYQKRLRNDWD